MPISWAAIRANTFVWIGIAGTAITLLGGLLSFGWIEAARLVADALYVWKQVTREAWSVAVGWLGIDLSGPILPLLNFVVFALLMATGVRLKSWLAGSEADRRQAVGQRRSRWWKIAVGALLIAAAVPATIFFFFDLAEPVGSAAVRAVRISDTVKIIYFCAALAIIVLLPGAVFGWVNGWSLHVLQVFVLAIFYSACVYGAPLLNATETMMSHDSFGISDDDVVALAWIMLSPAAVFAVFCLMLRIAPAGGLRDRLAMSTGTSLGLLAANSMIAWVWH